MPNQQLEIALTKVLSRNPMDQNQNPVKDLFREIIRSTIVCAVDSKPGKNGLEMRISGVNTTINGTPAKCISAFTRPAYAQDMQKLLQAEDDPSLTLTNQLFLNILMLGSSLNTPIVINPNSISFAIPPLLASHLLFAASLYESELFLLAEEKPLNVSIH